MFKHYLLYNLYICIFPFQLLVLSSVVVDFQYNEYIYWVKQSLNLFCIIFIFVIVDYIINSCQDFF